MRSLRVLCLHGFRGNGAALRTQLHGLVNDSQPELELLCPDAPALATGGPGWWDAVPLEATGSSGNSGHKRYQGWEQTRAWAISYFAEHGPIDGVLGFSQGAALAGLLVGLRSPSGLPTADLPLSFDFAILIGGFVSNDPSHAGLYAATDSYALPSLHLIGRADRIVSPETSSALAARFSAPQLVLHDGGHVIASTPEARAALAALLTTVSQRAPRGDAGMQGGF